MIIQNICLNWSLRKYAQFKFEFYVLYLCYSGTMLLIGLYRCAGSYVVCINRYHAVPYMALIGTSKPTFYKKVTIAKFCIYIVAMTGFCIYQVTVTAFCIYKVIVIGFCIYRVTMTEFCIYQVTVTV